MVSRSFKVNISFDIGFLSYSLSYIKYSSFLISISSLILFLPPNLNSTFTLPIPLLPKENETPLIPSLTTLPNPHPRTDLMRHHTLITNQINTIFTYINGPDQPTLSGPESHTQDLASLHPYPIPPFPLEQPPMAGLASTLLRKKLEPSSEDWLAAVWEGAAEVDVTEAELWLDGNENVVPLAEDVVDDDEEDCEPPEAEAVGKDNDTAELAMLQNSCETFSAAVRSPGHWVLMHPTSAAGNVDPLRISSVSYCLAG